MKNKLLEEIADTSEVPKEWLEKEIFARLEDDNLTLDDLREVLAEYLQDNFVEIKKEYLR